LVKSHKQAVGSAGDGQLGPDTVFDGRYAHSEVSFFFMFKYRCTGTCICVFRSNNIFLKVLTSVFILLKL